MTNSSKQQYPASGRTDSGKYNSPFSQWHHSLNQPFCVTVFWGSEKCYLKAFSWKHTLCLKDKIKNSSCIYHLQNTGHQVDCHGHIEYIYAQDKFLVIYNTEFFYVYHAVQTLHVFLWRVCICSFASCLIYGPKIYLSLSHFSYQPVLYQQGLSWKNRRPSSLRKRNPFLCSNYKFSKHSKRQHRTTIWHAGAGLSLPRWR